MDIENQFLTKTEILPVLTRYYGVGNLEQPSEVGRRALIKELAGVAGSEEKGRALLDVFDDQFADWTQTLMFFIGLFKNTSRFAFSLQDSNDSVVSMCGISGIEAINDYVTYTRHYGCVTELLPGETTRDIFEKIVRQVHAGHRKMDILSFEDVDGLLFTPDIVKSVREYFDTQLASTNYSYTLVNAPGGGTVVTQSFNRVIVKDNFAFLVMDRINYNPANAKIAYENPVAENVVQFGTK